MKRHAGAVIGLAVALLVCFLASRQPFFLESLELKLLDLRFRLRGEVAASERIALVAVDAASVDQVGRWPWPRATVAELVRRICAASPAAVGLDIVFSEPQEEPWRRVLQETLDRGGLSGEQGSGLRAALDAPAGDRQLADAVASCGDRIVLGYYFEEEGSRRGLPSNSPRNIFPSMLGQVRIQPQEPPFTVQESTGVETNLDLLSASARHHGFFNMIPDRDGLVRRYEMLRRFDGEIYPALALETARVAMGSPPLRLRVGPELDVRLETGDRRVVCDERGRVLIDWRGADHRFRYLSAADILSGALPAEELRGRVLLVGVTETGIKDQRATPMDAAFPGTEIHATVADSILRDHYLRRSGNDLLVDVLSVLALGLVAGEGLFRMRRAQGALLLAIGLLVAVFGLNTLAFRHLGIWVKAVYPLVTVAWTYVGVALYRTVVVERRAKQVRDVFEKYVASSIVEEVLRHPDRAVLGGTRRDLTILFSDIRGFTPLSETMEPEAVVQFLNAYLTPMTDIVLRRRGTLDKYMGDALMAFWGAPIEDPDHAGNACRAAIEMGRALEELRRSSAVPGVAGLEIGVGINSGIVSVGNMGSHQIYDYTVIGDAVNLASRLEPANKTYGTRILVSESTWEKVRGEGFAARELDRLRVKGKARPVTVLELLAGPGEEPPLPAAFLDLFRRGLDLYYGARFDEALALFREALAILPGDAPARLYVERCEAFRAEPPGPGWDGAFTMTTK